MSHKIVSVGKKERKILQVYLFEKAAKKMGMYPCNLRHTRSLKKACQNQTSLVMLCCQGLCCVSVKVYGYISMIFGIFKRETTQDLLFDFLDNVAYLKWGLLFGKKKCF